MGDGIWIPKVINVERIKNFDPILLLNVEGKIFFGVLAHCMMDFLLANRYMNISVQKVGISCFPGCPENLQMIWNSILSAKKNKTELHVIWLDLANQYGSGFFFG